MKLCLRGRASILHSDSPKAKGRHLESLFPNKYFQPLTWGSLPSSLSPFRLTNCSVVIMDLALTGPLPSHAPLISCTAEHRRRKTASARPKILTLIRQRASVWSESLPTMPQFSAQLGSKYLVAEEGRNPSEVSHLHPLPTCIHLQPACICLHPLHLPISTTPYK